MCGNGFIPGLSRNLSRDFVVRHVPLAGYPLVSHIQTRTNSRVFTPTREGAVDFRADQRPSGEPCKARSPQHAVVKEKAAICLLRVCDVVGDQHEGRGGFPAKREQQLNHRVTRVFVEVARGLVG